MCVGIVFSLGLVGGCTNKKCIEPNEPVSYLMKDYFPLNIEDEWIWEHEQADSMAESFVDISDSSLGEPYTDQNHNGQYDFGEYFEDANLNGKYDSPNDPWTPGIPYFDKTNNGKYDSLNGVWDPGEPLTDLDSNGIWNWILYPDTSIWKGQIMGKSYSDSNVIITRQSSFSDTINDLIIYDGYFFDSLGLRWCSHIDFIHHSTFYDELASSGIILTLTKPNIELNDSVINVGTQIYYFSFSVTWISVPVGFENVSTPAGEFSNCLKIRSVVSGWVGTMAGYNGTSYQWYAKNVGMVKSEGPGEGEYWILKSAKVGSRNYP